MSVNRLRPCSWERDSSEAHTSRKGRQPQQEVCLKRGIGCLDESRREAPSRFARAACLLALLIPLAARGQAAPLGPRVNSTATASVLVGSTPETVSVDRFAGEDLGAKITAAQDSLAGRAAILQIDTAGTIATPATLNLGNSLQIGAAVNIAATVTLVGSNRIWCSGSGALTISKAPAFTSSGNNLRLDDCRATGNAAGATVLDTKGSNITIDHNTITSAVLLAAHGGDHVLAQHNAFNSPSPFKGYAVVWQNTSYVTIDSNQVNNYGDPFEFFNANADPACYAKGGACAGQTYPGTRALVETHGGHYIFSNNTCTNAGACYWGSVGHDIQVTGNSASHCGDVCYDVEGSVDAVFDHNRGEAAANGVGSTFFFTDHVSFLNNNFTSSTGSTLIRVFNSSINPTNNEFLTVQDNTLTCLKLICTAVGGDPADHVVIEHNAITDGVIGFTNSNGNGSLKVANNVMTFTVTGTKPFNAISSSQTLDSGLVEIANNTVKGVAEPAGSSCIAFHNSDYNSTITLQVENNHCVGGFPNDITTVNAGGNAGTGVITSLSGNYWGHDSVVHVHTTGNVDRYSESDSYIQVGGRWRRQVHGAAGGSTR